MDVKDEEMQLKEDKHKFL
jgi:hypothetical protein